MTTSGFLGIFWLGYATKAVVDGDWDIAGVFLVLGFVFLAWFLGVRMVVRP